MTKRAVNFDAQDKTHYLNLSINVKQICKYYVCMYIYTQMYMYAYYAYMHSGTQSFTLQSSACT